MLQNILASEAARTTGEDFGCKYKIDRPDIFGSVESTRTTHRKDFQRYDTRTGRRWTIPPRTLISSYSSFKLILSREASTKAVRAADSEPQLHLIPDVTIDARKEGEDGVPCCSPYLAESQIFDCRTAATASRHDCPWRLGPHFKGPVYESGERLR